MPTKTPAEKAVEFLIAELGDAGKWEYWGFSDDFGVTWNKIQHRKTGIEVEFINGRPIFVDFDDVTTGSKRWDELYAGACNVAGKLSSRSHHNSTSLEALALCAKLGIEIEERKDRDDGS